MIEAFFKITNWDDFLSGADNAISGEAKQGALLFYGKGKCVACHTGPLMSDFNYHNVGIPDHGPGIDGNGKDYGRYNVTGNEKDKYRFRTPPLRNVSETAPYFHNGSVPTIYHVLDSKSRPTYWRRSFNNKDYNWEHLGWKYKEKDSKIDKYTYDTTLRGYGNQGHTFGDGLTSVERMQLIEYLKTL